MTPLSRWRERRRRIRAARWLDREIRRAAYERLAGRPRQRHRPRKGEPMKELFNPDIVPRSQQLLAGGLVLCSVLNLVGGRWLAGAILVLYAAYVLVTQAGRYHTYRAGYWRGVIDRGRGVVRDDPHPDDMDRREKTV